MTNQSAGERVFMDQPNVKITSARAIINGTTYALANVTSVKTFVQEPNPRVLIYGSIIFLSGGLLLLGHITEPGLVIMAIGAIVLAIYFFLLKPTFWVRIGTAGAEANAIGYRDQAQTKLVVDAMNDAIVHRG